MPIEGSTVYKIYHAVEGSTVYKIYHAVEGSTVYKIIIFILTIIFGNIIIYIILLSLWQNPLLVELIYVIKMFRKVDIARWCRTSVTNIFYNRVLLKKRKIPIYFVGTLNNTVNVVIHFTLSFLWMNTSGQRYSLGWWHRIKVKLGDSQF